MVQTYVHVDGAGSKIAIAQDIKLVGVQAMATEKDVRVYKGTAATEVNLVARVGADQPCKVIMFPKDREVPCNGVYIAVDNDHGAILWYIE